MNDEDRGFAQYSLGVFFTILIFAFLACLVEIYKSYFPQ
jgi:hypothetical protein